MTYEQFDLIVDRVFGAVRKKMSAKSQEYSRNEDKLHNFKRAAAIRQTYPEDALWGMVIKQITSICDFIDDIKRGQEQPTALWDEKIEDTIAYLILLRALLDERIQKGTPGGPFCKQPEPPSASTFTGTYPIPPLGPSTGGVQRM